MAVALYRKYRPKTFGEMVGQEHVTEPLSQALRTGRLHHAYLFSGPRGCGKTSSARILARSLNCVQGPTPEPCGVCDSCVALGPDGGGSIDVVEIDAASHGGVDDARDLRERAFYTPVSGRFKIYIIDEAHMVSSAGFNALLKLVEEPPEYVKFVFATTEPEKVLPTIKSRTHHYPFRLFPPAVVRPYLEQLCQAEGIAVEQAVFPLVVRAGGGSMRDTLSVLDQLIAGAGPDGVGYARAAVLLGVTDAALLDDICDALVAGDGAAVFAAIDRVAEAGHDPRRFAADLLERFRDLIVLQQVPDAVAKGLLDAPADQLARMSTHAAQLGPAALSRCAEIVHNGLVEMRGTTSPRLLLELVCARMLLPATDAAEGSAAVLHRLERLERRLGAAGDTSPAPAPSSAPPAPASAPPAPAPSSAPPAPAPASAPPAPAPSSASAPPAPPEPAPDPPPAPPPAEPAPAPPAASEPDPAAAPQPAPSLVPPPAAPPQPPGASGGIDATAMRRVWDEVVATVGRRSKRSAAVVREATVRDVEDGTTIVLQFQHGVHATMLSGNPRPVLDAVHEVLGGVWQLRCESGDVPLTSDPVPPPAPSAAPGPADWPEPARPGGVAAAPPPPDSPPPAPASRAAGDAGGLDEQVDLDGDERTTPGSSEQQAIQLLQQTLGAERIGEVAP